MVQYLERDAQALDEAGGYYTRHVCAMTRERLDAKSDIAAELAWRDKRIDELSKALKTCADELIWMIEKHNVQNMEDGSWLYDYQTPCECLELLP